MIDKYHIFYKNLLTKRGTMYYNNANCCLGQNNEEDRKKKY